MIIGEVAYEIVYMLVQAEKNTVKRAAVPKVGGLGLRRITTPQSIKAVKAGKISHYTRIFSLNSQV